MTSFEFLRWSDFVVQTLSLRDSSLLWLLFKFFPPGKIPDSAFHFPKSSVRSFTICKQKLLRLGHQLSFMTSVESLGRSHLVGQTLSLCDSSLFCLSFRFLLPQKLLHSFFQISHIISRKLKHSCKLELMSCKRTRLVHSHFCLSDLVGQALTLLDNLYLVTFVNQISWSGTNLA